MRLKRRSDFTSNKGNKSRRQFSLEEDGSAKSFLQEKLKKPKLAVA